MDPKNDVAGKKIRKPVKVADLKTKKDPKGGVESLRIKLVRCEFKV